MKGEILSKIRCDMRMRIKKIFIAILVICLGFIFNMQIDYAAENINNQHLKKFWSGTGTPRDPFVITSAEDLKVLSDWVNDGNDVNNIYFMQSADINLNELSEWNSIGVNNCLFNGNYNGNGYSIYGNSEVGNQTVFENNAGRIYNLSVKDNSINKNMIIVQNLTDKGYIVNCYLDGNFPEEKMVNIKNCLTSYELEKQSAELWIGQLNSGLEELVVKYGIHCNELKEWGQNSEGTVILENSFGETYLTEIGRRLKGDGTERNPYIIETSEDVVFLREHLFYGEDFSRKFLQQSQDIDLSEINVWLSFSGGSAFSGVYDGNGYSLLNVDLEEREGQSIFGVVSGTIMNMSLDIINGNEETNGIAEHVSNSGKIINSSVAVKSTVDVRMNLIAYKNDGYIDNCLFEIPDYSEEFRIVNEGGAVYCHAVYQSDDEGRRKAVSELNNRMYEAAFRAGIRIDNMNTWKNEQGIFSEKWTYSLKNTVTFFIFICSKHILLPVSIGILLVMIFIKSLLKKGGLIKLSCKVISEIFIIWTLIMLFWNLMILYKGTSSWHWNQVVFSVIGNGIWLALFFSIATVMWKKWKSWKFRYNNIRIELLAVIIVILVMGSVNMSVYPLYDANLYYGGFINGVKDFDFNISTFLSGFYIWGKQFHFISWILFPGEFFSPGTAKGVYAVNLILLVIASICIYRILEIQFGEMSHYIKAGLTLCFATFPFVMSGVTYINPDYYCAIFFVLMVYCYLQEYNILFAFSALLLMGAKQNMAVTYVIFLLIMEGKNFWGIKRLKKGIKERPVIVWILPLVGMLFIYFIGRFGGGGAMEKGVNRLGQIVVNRFWQCFGFGFKWMIILLFVVICIKLITQTGIRQFWNLNMKKNLLLVAVVISSFLQLVVYLITYSSLALCPRYFSQTALAFILLLGFSLDKGIKTGVWKKISISMITVLMCIQVYKTIDPSILLFADYLNFQNGKIYILNDRHLDEAIGVGDNSTYNMEYDVWGSLFEKMMKDMNINSDVQFYSTLDEEHLLICDDYRFGITNREWYNVYWNSEKENISYLKGTDNYQISIEAVNDNSYSYDKEKMLNRKKIYLLEPDSVNHSLREKLMDEGYEITKISEYKNAKTTLRLVELKRTEEKTEGL